MIKCIFGNQVLEAHRKICGVYRDNALIECSAQKWFAKLYSGDMSLEVAFRSSQLIEVDSIPIKILIVQDRSLYLQIILETLKTGFGTV